MSETASYFRLYIHDIVHKLSQHKHTCNYKLVKKTICSDAVAMNGRQYVSLLYVFLSALSSWWLTASKDHLCRQCMFLHEHIDGLNDAYKLRIPVECLASSHAQVSDYTTEQKPLFNLLTLVLQEHSYCQGLYLRCTWHLDP